MDCGVPGDLFAHEGQAVFEGRNFERIEQRVMEGRDPHGLKLARDAHARRRGAFARIAAPVQDRLIPSQHRSGGAGERPNALKVEGRRGVGCVRTIAP